MFNQSTQSFISAHLNDDVRQLALRPVADKDIDLKAALQQIAGWQKARVKLPLWAEREGMVYPPHISMEQCSSESTARYKATVARRLAAQRENGAAGTLVDLTGGFGVDFSYMAEGFDRAVYVERQEHLCDIARHNFNVLGLAHTEVINASAEDVLAGLDGVSLIFLDPARRDSAGNRTFAISDCTPDALSLKDALLAKAPTVMVKLSPMLDWRKAVSDFGGAVSEVHIVASGGECKELLLVLDRNDNAGVDVFCVNDDDILSYNTADTEAQTPAVGPVPDNAGHLCEPNAAVMKAGCFSLIERRYGTRRIGLNSNLFVSADAPCGFPGRVFAIESVTTMNRKELKTTLAGLTRANITVRNFPLTVAELRKRLKLKDGGDVYLFATTDSEGRHVIVKCRKTNVV